MAPVRGIDIECDQGVGRCNNSGSTTKVVRTDTYGAYWFNADATGNPGNAGGTGTWPTIGDTHVTPRYAIQPTWQRHATTVLLDAESTLGSELRRSNTSVAYMALNGYIYRTSNLSSCTTSSIGLLESPTGFVRDTSMVANDAQGAYGPKIAIDPANPNIIIVCTEKNGCFQTTDGGTSFALPLLG